MGVAEAMAYRSPCSRHQIGACIVDKNQRVLATGYNGPPANWPEARGTLAAECKLYCPRAQEGAAPGESYTDCVSIHAEANALLFGDRRDREGGTIYTTGYVCWDCSKLVANSGLRRVVYSDDGGDYRIPSRGIDFMTKSGLEVVAWPT